MKISPLFCTCALHILMQKGAKFSLDLEPPKIVLKSTTLKLRKEVFEKLAIQLALNFFGSIA